VFCPKCGARNEDDATFCSRCANPLTPGASTGPPTTEGGAPTVEDGSVGALGILFFCIPLVGAVMYFVWKDEKPAKAKQACTLALWGVGVGIVLQILATLLRQ
jgi:uncharacterized membrane protein YvbJ